MIPVLELFVVYPHGASAWTAEFMRRRDGAEQWTTIFTLTCSDRGALMRNLSEHWRGVTWTELRPVVQ